MAWASSSFLRQPRSTGERCFGLLDLVEGLLLGRLDRLLLGLLGQLVAGGFLDGLDQLLLVLEGPDVMFLLGLDEELALEAGVIQARLQLVEQLDHVLLGQVQRDPLGLGHLLEFDHGEPIESAASSGPERVGVLRSRKRQAGVSKVVSVRCTRQWLRASSKCTQSSQTASPRAPGPPQAASVPSAGVSVSGSRPSISWARSRLRIPAMSTMGGIVKCCGWQESASQRFQAASFHFTVDEWHPLDDLGDELVAGESAPVFLRIGGQFEYHGESGYT